MKTTTRILTLVLCMMAMMPTSAAANELDDYYFYADVNGDGLVTVADMVIVIDCILYGGNSTVVPNPNTNPGYVSSKEYGAVGDGITDDTRALESLFEAAFRLKKKVYLEPGTYLIHRSLTLKTGMEIYGSEATITRPRTVATSLTEAAARNQIYIDVEDASLFNVGDQIFIYDPAGANCCTHAVINRKEGNRIHFNNVISDNQTDFMGCVNAYDPGTQVTTAFPLLRSWSTRFDCDGVTVRDLTLDGNRLADEPASWANSCLCIDAFRPGGFTDTTGVEYCKVQRGLTARHLTIRNSPGDGISDHGEGDLDVQYCTIENSAMHGIQMASGFSHALILENTMTGNGVQGSGVYFGQDVCDVVMRDNVITAFENGCGVDQADACVKQVFVRNSQFKDITGDVFAFSTQSATAGGMLQISNNIIRGLNSLLFNGNNLDGVLLYGNEVKSITTVPPNMARATMCNNVIFSANKIPTSAVFSTPVIATGTTNIIQSSNTWN